MRSSKDAPLNSVRLAIAHRDGVRISADADWDVMGVRGTASIPAEIETRLGRDDFIGGLGGFNSFGRFLRHQLFLGGGVFVFLIHRVSLLSRFTGRYSVYRSASGSASRQSTPHGG